MSKMKNSKPIFHFNVDVLVRAFQCQYAPLLLIPEVGFNINCIDVPSRSRRSVTPLTLTTSPLTIDFTVFKYLKFIQWNVQSFKHIITLCENICTN